MGLLFFIASLASSAIDIVGFTTFVCASATFSFSPRSVLYNSGDQSFLNAAIQHIESNIDNASFNVESLCQMLNLSQPQVYRKVKAQTKLNITEFIRNIRLKKLPGYIAPGI